MDLSLNSPRGSALLVFIVAFATIGAAWIFQLAGYQPCDLCLEQRPAYYVGVPLAGLAAALAPRLPRAALLLALAALAAIFAVNAGLSVYHSGVEWKLWQGPTACAGAYIAPQQGSSLIEQLETVKVVRCDEAQLKIFGLSLANWDVLISLFLAGVASRGLTLRERGASTNATPLTQPQDRAAAL